MAFRLRIDDFAEGGAIPREFTCEGKDEPPVLRWEGEPEGTRSFALIMDDPDAPGGTWNHWLLWDIPAEVHSLGDGGEAEGGGLSGTNDFGRRGYGGPCPPAKGGTHRYFFRLFALDTARLGLAQGAQRGALEKALRKHAVGESAYMGRYQRGWR